MKHITSMLGCLCIPILFVCCGQRTPRADGAVAEIDSLPIPGPDSLELEKFYAFASLFPDLEGDSISDRTSFNYVRGLFGESEIRDSISQSFIPMTDEEKAFTERVYNHCGCRITLDSCYVFLFLKCVDAHDMKRGGYPYVAPSIITYSRDGRFLNMCDIAKSDDNCDYTITGTRNPLRLHVEHMYMRDVLGTMPESYSADFMDTEVRVTPSGAIITDTLGTARGTTVWSDEINNFRWTREE